MKGGQPDAVAYRLPEQGAASEPEPEPGDPGPIETEIVIGEEPGDPGPIGTVEVTVPFGESVAGRSNATKGVEPRP